VDLALRFLERQPQAIKVIDPVLGDDGRMYRALPKDMPQAMRRLCAAADVITPNLTEAALLTGMDLFSGVSAEGALGTNPAHPPVSLGLLNEIMDRLAGLGAPTVLLTGVPLDGAHVNAWMHSGKALQLCEYEPVPASYPGTGDLFASVLAGALVRELPFPDAVALATDYVRETMQVTMDCQTEPVYGVQLEKTLPRLMNPESFN